MRQLKARTKQGLPRAGGTGLTATTEPHAGVGAELELLMRFWGSCLPQLTVRGLCFGHHIVSIISAYDITSAEEAAYSSAVASSHPIHDCGNRHLIEIEATLENSESVRKNPG